MATTPSWRGCPRRDKLPSVREHVERLYLPAAADGFREIDDRYPCVTRCRDPQRFGGKERPLRVEHFEERRAASFVAHIGDVERLRQQVAPLRLRGEHRLRRLVG